MCENPEVSIIVPARNEEQNIEKCLRSLLAQTDIAFEIIVVDDQSDDDTRRIAESIGGVRVISAQPLRTGWTGKVNAIQSAIPFARGRWLLFTDADTTHLPDTLRKSVREAQQHGVSLLSYSPRQELGSFWEKALQPVIFAELNKRFKYEEINKMDSQDVAANGQFMLVDRQAYESIGGHAAVKDSLLEDVDLARVIKQVGRIRFRYAGEAVSTRMYRGRRDLVEGWSKNLAVLFPEPWKLALLRVLESTALILCPVAFTAMLMAGHLSAAVLVVVPTIATYYWFIHRLNKAGFGLNQLLFSIGGLPVFAYLLVRSHYLHAIGKQVAWKGRIYQIGKGGGKRN